ncbi:uncharacterized protein P884DRAFT_265472 [Thermothelomyces heterothallicus CBS 202.75]|uniref:uncharacterized protein n=1 Tax=Thermothelomyces heterothallicus CBS 202.75 TaxID=1149848 RepID=UPI003743C9B1
MESTLSDWLKAGRYLDVLLSEPADLVIAEFVRTLQTETPTTRQDQSDGSTVEQKASEGATASVSARDRLAVALAALNAFLQGNVTGPVLGEGKLERLLQRFCSASGSHVTAAGRTAVRKACLRSLDVDGVSVYEHVPMVEVFCLARHLLTSEQGVVDGADLGEGAERSAKWLALRVHVWHYKLLTQPSLGPGSVFNKASQWCDVPSLRDTIEKALEDLTGEILLDGRGDWSGLQKVQFLVEKANVCIMLGQDGKAREALNRASELSGFVYALSGALGKRTRFQEKSTSQLVVLAKSGEGLKADGEQAKPQALALNDDTLLEDVEFTKEEKPQDGEGDQKAELPAPLRDLAPDEQPQLSPLDQIILLAEATLKDAFSPADSLTSEEVLPFAIRVISDKATNWQIYTHALLVRSRIEVHRSRTVERGVLQMQALVDQVIVDTTQPAEEATDAKEPEAAVPEIQITTDKEEASKPANKPASFFPAPKPTESAPARVRLEHIHALSSPPRWHLESELAYAWAGVGSLVSALEIFKRLRLWAEVALCFASNAAKDDEDGRGSNGEAKAKAVVRWRLFHRTGTPAEHQAPSGEADDEEVDVEELKEADYHGPERQPPPPNAPRLWCILGDLENDPTHYERAWEISNHRFARAQKSLGEYYLQQKKLERARDAYRKAVAVNRLSSELWNRMGDISLRLGDFSEAAEAYRRAIACSDNIGGGEDARTWSNLGSALYSLYVERTKELKQQTESGEADETTNVTTTEEDDGQDDDDNADVTSAAGQPSQRSSRADPSTLLAQSLAAYKRGANIAQDNWRIWDNVITLAARLRPVPIRDLLQALRQIVRIRKTEDALDIDILRLLLNEGLLSREKSKNATAATTTTTTTKPPCQGQQDDGAAAYEPPRGSTERAVCDFLETTLAPLVTARSELWELVTRERVWREDYAGAVDAAERAWRAAVGSSGGGGGLLPSGGGGGGGGNGDAKGGRKNWLEEREEWRVVVDRTDDLVSMLENYGEGVPEIGARWKAKARSAVRSVMGKAKENWEGTEEWDRLVALLEGLR